MIRLPGNALEYILMTHLLEMAFQRAGNLPPEEQDRLASAILADLESGGRWDRAFAGSQDVLGRLAPLQ